MFGVTVMIYCDGTLKILRIPICSGFPDCKIIGPSVVMATNFSPLLSPHWLCLVALNTQGKQLETFLHARFGVRFE